MPSLIQEAKQYKTGREMNREITREELELYVAYIDGEVTAYQAKSALGRSSGYFMNWCRRCMMELYRRNKLTLEFEARKVVFKPKSFTEYKEIDKKRQMLVVHK